MTMTNHEISSVFSHVTTKFATATPPRKVAVLPWRFPIKIWYKKTLDRINVVMRHP
jgi:hypothetical protein